MNTQTKQQTGEGNAPREFSQEQVDAMLNDIETCDMARQALSEGRIKVTGEGMRQAKAPQHSPLPFNPITDDWKQRPDAYAKWAVESFNALHKAWSKVTAELERVTAERDALLAALKELSGAIEEHGSLEVDKNGNPVNQNAAGRNYDRRCEARAKALNAIAKAEQTIKN